MDREMESVLRQLRELSNVIPKDDGDIASPSTSKANVYSQAALERIHGYENAFASNARTIDPKIKKQREKLPIFKRKNELLEAIQNNQVLIIKGETGSGKTTQIPQYLQEAGVAVSGRIGCTQLRRIAAKRAAARVAKEQGCKVGEDVGYIIRFDDKTSEKTKILYMTDGILLRECMRDRTLSNYAAIILDESHERSIDTDVLLAVLKWIIKTRNDVKLIISSATLDSDKFSAYFYDATVFVISGHMFPVDIIYTGRLYNRPYVDVAAACVIKINETEKEGDILVFMTGEQDIGELENKLLDYRNSLYPDLEVLPCYSALPWETQEKIFEKAKPNSRKVIIATNIAETSLTVDGIRFVVDSGYVKQKVYDWRKQCEVLKQVEVSQAQAVQRTGRAGRVAPGKCYRLYSENDFSNFVEGPEPEIKRSVLTNCMLLLKRMGFSNMDDFDFLDRPTPENVDEALTDLELLKAIESKQGPITACGIKMSAFPLEPNLSKMLIVSEELGCSEEMLTIVALLSVPSIFTRPRKKQKLADAAKAAFHSNHGDLITYLNVYNEWLRYDKDENWCKTSFVHSKVLHEAFYIREQLFDIMKANSMVIKSSGVNHVPIMKSICTGFFKNVAEKLPGMREYKYRTLPKHEITYIHPASSVFRIKPQWVVYQKVVTTTKEYMRNITPIELTWVQEYCNVFY